jgi:hypothetical protein
VNFELLYQFYDVLKPLIRIVQQHVPAPHVTEDALVCAHIFSANTFSETESEI